MLDLFKHVTTEHGMPSRVQGDRGGENIDVATYMIMSNGPCCALFIWGSYILTSNNWTLLIHRARSTCNTHIERLWVEVGTQFARRWRAFFTQLKNLHFLDAQNPAHLWLLHTLFLEDINQSCINFQNEWNCHPVSGPDMNNKSLNVNFFSIVSSLARQCWGFAGYASHRPVSVWSLSWRLWRHSPWCNKWILRRTWCSSPLASTSKWRRPSCRRGREQW